jgi:hypothetical protein
MIDFSNFVCANNMNLGGKRKPLVRLWYVGLCIASCSVHMDSGLHCQQGDELTQQLSLELRKLRGLVSHRRRRSGTSLTCPNILQAIALKSIYSEVKSKYVGRFV